MKNKIKAEIEVVKKKLILMGDSSDMGRFLRGYLGALRNTLMWAEETEKNLKDKKYEIKALTSSKETEDWLDKKVIEWNEVEKAFNGGEK